MIYLDTHIIVWLYAKKLSLLSSKSVKLIEESKVRLYSPIVELELKMLFDINRINKEPHVILDELYKTIELRVCDRKYESAVKEAKGIIWTRDPYDRLIVAQASLNNNSLITKDEIIRKHYKYSVW